jgi:hypothetical protein
MTTLMTRGRAPLNIANNIDIVAELAWQLLANQGSGDDSRKGA